jgi:hypothetical protein
MSRNGIQLALLWLVRRFPEAARAALLHTAADRHDPCCCATAVELLCAFFSTSQACRSTQSRRYRRPAQEKPFADRRHLRDVEISYA